MSETEQRPNIDLLQSVLHNSEIGICSINYLLPEVDSNDFVDTIKSQKTKLKEITNRAKQLGQKLKIELKPNSCLKKGKMWISIKMSSFFDDDTQHLADLMILGHFMGTINMIKSLADCANADPEIIQLARDLKTLEEECVNELIPYLERTKK